MGLLQGGKIRQAREAISPAQNDVRTLNGGWRHLFQLPLTIY